mgnify:CR=1 FL=1
MIRRPPRSTLDRSSAASDVYKRQALQNALCADVDPTAGGHLAVHDQPLGLQAVEVGLGGPVGDDVAVGDEDARRIGCLLYTSPSPRDRTRSRMPSSA